MKNILYILVLLLCCNFSLHSQSYLGGEIGFNNYKSSNQNFIIGGVKFEKRTATEKVSIYIAELFESSTRYNNRNISYLKTVIGLDINLGNKIYGIFGTGIAPKVLIKNNDYTENPNKLVLDCKFNTGLGYRISNQFHLSFTWQYHINLTPYATEDIANHFGGSSTSKRFDNNAFLQLNIAFKLKK